MCGPCDLRSNRFGYQRFKDTNRTTKSKRSYPWEVCRHLSSCWKCYVAKQATSPRYCAQGRPASGNRTAWGQRVQVLWNPSQISQGRLLSLWKNMLKMQQKETLSTEMYSCWCQFQCNDQLKWQLRTGAPSGWWYIIIRRRVIEYCWFWRKRLEMLHACWRQEGHLPYWHRTFCQHASCTACWEDWTNRQSFENVEPHSAFASWKVETECTEPR